MKDKPYVYTMPENFLLDQSVPARWRLLAVINGFLLNGKEFYGSNAWLMEQLDCSEQTVSNAVQELEDLGEIVCTRTRRSRLINRNLRDPSQLGSRPKLVRVSDPSSFGTNSESNSDNKIQGNFSSSKKTSQDPEYELRELDGNDMPVAPKPAKAVVPKDESFAVLSQVKSMIEKDTGADVILGDTALKSIKRALQYISPKDVLTMVDDALADGSAEKRGFTMHYILSDANINKYKAENT